MLKAAAPIFVLFLRRIALAEVCRGFGDGGGDGGAKFLLFLSEASEFRVHGVV